MRESDIRHQVFGQEPEAECHPRIVELLSTKAMCPQPDVSEVEMKHRLYAYLRRNPAVLDQTADRTQFISLKPSDWDLSKMTPELRNTLLSKIGNYRFCRGKIPILVSHFYM